MHRLTKVLFWITDLTAWLLIAFAVVSATAYPFAGPVWARYEEHRELATSAIVLTCLAWTSIAFGAFLITRRKVFGILFVIAPIVATAAANGGWLTGLALSAFPAIFFGAPFFLVLLKVRAFRSRSAP